MRVLLDESVPRQLAPLLRGHEVTTVQRHGWAGTRNGDLLRRASQEFQVLVMGDQGFQFQQNLSGVSLGVVIIAAQERMSGSLSDPVTRGRYRFGPRARALRASAAMLSARLPKTLALRFGAVTLTLLCFAAISAPPAGATCAAPASVGDGWEVATPDASGFDVAALCETLASVAAGSANLHGVVIERHGRLVAELYRRGPDLSIDFLYGLWHPFATDGDFGPTTRHDLRSISKSVVGLLVGVAMQQGKIKSLATPALEFYPEYASLRSPERDAIHLEHLVTMSSGLDWDEAALPNDETRLYWDWTPYRFVLSRPLVAEPGAVFHYNSGGTAVLADILIRTSGKPLTELARAELFEPLAITDWEWVSDPHGRALAFTGLRMRPRDLMKIGRLVLDHGQWRGQQLVPAQWIAESLRPRIATGFRSPPTASDEMHYGYQWWTGTADWHGTKVAWSAGFGNGGQRLFVVPELDLTVVITAGDYGSREISHTANHLLEQVVASVAR